MIKKNSVVAAQYKLTVPKDIREHLKIDVGAIAKWVLDESDGTLQLRFINV